MDTHAFIVFSVMYLFPLPLKNLSPGLFSHFSENKNGRVNGIGRVPQAPNGSNFSMRKEKETEKKRPKKPADCKAPKAGTPYF